MAGGLLLYFLHLILSRSERGVEGAAPYIPFGGRSMKSIPCTIETFHGRSDDCWVISVSAEHAAEAALEFASMHLGRSDKVVFSDKTKRFTIRPDSATLEQRTITVNTTWSESVWCLFLDAYQNGWTNTAHLDQDFHDRNGSLCITIELTYPGT